MMTLWGPSPPDGGEQSLGQSHGDHEYAMWDAAYVLGSLSPTDRRDFESHLGVCPSCRSAVAELSGMPALLSQLDRDEISELNDADREPALPPSLLPSLLAKVTWQRRRSRLIAWTTSAAAAVVLAVAVFVGVHGHLSTPAPSAPPQAVQPTQTMDQVGTTALASTFSLVSETWGTYIDMKCVCLAPVTAHHDRLAMVVVGRDGSRTRLATWTAEPGHTASPSASISTPASQIAAVQVVMAENDEVLLQRSL